MKVSQYFSKLFFMIKLNIPIEKELADLCNDVHAWPDKLDRELASSEEKHAMERSRLEE
jgi:hypothetical protein